MQLGLVLYAQAFLSTNYFEPILTLECHGTLIGLASGTAMIYAAVSMHIQYVGTKCGVPFYHTIQRY